MNKKKIIVLVALVIVFIGVVVCNKLIKTNNTKESGNVNSTNSSTKKDYSLEDAKKMIDKYYVSNSYENVFETDYTESAKTLVAISNVESSKISKIDCTKYYESNKPVREDVYGYCDGNSNAINYDDVNSEYKKLFGSKTNALKDYFSYGVSAYDYNDSLDSYIELNIRDGAVNSNIYKYSVKSAYTKGKNLTIDVYYYKFEYEDEKYISSISNKEYSYSDITSSDFDSEFIKEYKTEIPLYRFVFKQEDNHYKLNIMTRI